MATDLTNFHTTTPAAIPITATMAPTAANLDSNYGDIKPKSGQQQLPKGFLAFANGPPKWAYVPVLGPHPPPPPPPASTNACTSPPTPPQPKETSRAASPVVVSYKECLRNHAASIGGHALDGCCEFMPSPSFIPSDPTSLKCAACGCHRNFHRRDPDDPNPIHHHAALPHSPLLPYQSSPPPPPPPPPSQQQQQIQQPEPHHNHPNSTTYFSSALLALSQSPAGGGIKTDDQPMGVSNASGSGRNPFHSRNLSGRKRFRTKFSQEQKAKMYDFAEKVGWRLNKSDDAFIKQFCNEIGVGRTVLKVWLHNNKNTIGNTKRDNSSGSGGGGTGNGNATNIGTENGNFAPVIENGFHNHNNSSRNNNGVKKISGGHGGRNSHHDDEEHDQDMSEDNDDGNSDENFQAGSSHGSGSTSSG